MTYYYHPLKVYAIRHNVTNRVYIGSSYNVDTRLKNHMTALRAHKHPVEDMQADFDKYGEDFTFTILEDITPYHNNRHREYEWMEKYQSHIRGIGYNYKDGYFRRKIIHRVTYQGKTMSLGEWSAETGIPYNALYSRIFQGKWDIEKAFTTPYEYRRKLWNSGLQKTKRD